MSAPARTGRPFSDALGITPLGDGRFRADLDEAWSIGAKAHGGLLMAVMTRAAITRAADGAPGTDPEPLVVAADFLRAPDLGPVELRTEVLKTGRTVSVVAVRLLQDERLMLSATVTAGTLPADEPRWAEPVLHPSEPTADALGAGTPDRPAVGLAAACDLRFPADANPFMRGETGPPRMSGWVRPLGEEPDVLFALLAGDVLAPTVFNLGGRFGWAPTIQLTALLRGRPAPGWLRVDSESRSVTGAFFDEDVSVVDSAGRLVCQARQLALAPKG
ncbi:thioesterase family protein [Pseudonocardia endophytica]|uniref:Acyl-CoA thioesterase n=1 Tax=Pseudonocardia endophytica TaxID=401976 RepID=A0A4R1HH48_PSEEN|nr:thioesterase family protein [Pseudonocardia endophytica]TCK20181.1 acyl-CoA thioesterase [Pseudonocardia endophytica]